MLREGTAYLSFLQFPEAEMDSESVAMGKLLRKTKIQLEQTTTHRNLQELIESEPGFSIEHKYLGH